MSPVLFLVGILVSTAQALYPSSSDVVSLTSGNFDRLVKNSDNVWIVEFFAPWCGHCQSLVADYSKAATALKGVVKVGAVDGDEDKSLSSQHNVRGFPTIKIMYGKTVEDYQGPRTAQGLIEAAMKAVKKKIEGQMGGGGRSYSDDSSSGDKNDVVELTDSNFDKLVLNSDEPWLVEFFAPWCGHCKRLEPEWAKAASQLKGKVKLGALDATVHSSKASEFNVKGYPTIKFFPAKSKSQSDAEDYEGGRTASDIVTFGEDKAVQNLPPPELVQITDQDSLTEGCEKHSLCVLAFLPSIFDCQADCRNAYLTSLKNSAENFKKQGWGWMWSQAVDHMKLEEVLDIGGFGYPAMAVVNVKKGKYSLFRGSFSETGINEFLRDLSYSRGSTAPIRGTSLPKIAKVDAWDGKDGVLPEEDDSYDDKDEL